ncbi:hypothetical protein BJX61DRAFT_500011 [Aspergillus egyptiacus]|nr:hypothetical protein BJX61DRAFT_500011 [Aspergillus egyptiacus]
MANNDMWRKTCKDRAFASVYKISVIMNWGSTTFQAAVLESLILVTLQYDPFAV